MKTSIKIYWTLSIILLFATSCGMMEDNNKTLSKDYELEYSIEANVENISKIVYTDINGNTDVLQNIDGQWNINAKGESGQTIKLEVFGTHKDDGESNISMRINAKNGEYYTSRDIDNIKKSNKHFHYYLIHVLE